MTYKLTWLPGVLQARGIDVVEYRGWETRGHGDIGDIQGVLCHHTCGPLHGDLSDIGVLVDGRSDLAGPLCNIGLGRSGRVTMVAAGKGYHAGKGYWQGIADGNAHMIGIEAENTGETTGPRADTWPEAQMVAYAKVCAAICDYAKIRSVMVAGHKEYALPRGRKDDPNFDMIAFRARVTGLMGQSLPSSASVSQRTGIVAVDKLNVRASASASSRALAVLNVDTEISILDETLNGSTKWYKTKDGYVSARFISLK